MRVKSLILVSSLSVLAIACAPHHHHPYPAGEPWHGHHFAGPGACEPEACAYGSRCFSSGAIRSNDGACQQCSGGKWVNTTGCSEHECGEMCRGKMSKMSKPCEGEHAGGRKRHP